MFIEGDICEVNVMKLNRYSGNPILEPEEDYELEGDVPNVVFPAGIVVIDNKLIVFYGGADKVCCAASVDLDEFIDDLLLKGKR